MKSYRFTLCLIFFIQHTSDIYPCCWMNLVFSFLLCVCGRGAPMCELGMEPRASQTQGKHFTTKLPPCFHFIAEYYSTGIVWIYYDLSIHLLMDICFQALVLVNKSTKNIHDSFPKNTFSFLLVYIHLRVQLLGYIKFMLNFTENCQTVPKWLFHYTSPPTVHWSSNCYKFLPTSNIIFNFSYSIRY